jgi:hemoglobin
MRRFRWLVLVVTAALLAAGRAPWGAAGGDRAEPLSRDDLDKRVHKVLYKVLLEGRELYGDNRPNAAAFLLQGAAMSLEPMLEHRPKLQKELQAKLAAAQAMGDGPDRAKTLYFALMEIYDGTVDPILPAPPPLRGQTLWERAGGKEGVTKIIDDFVEGCLKNPKANFSRDGAYLQTPEKVAALKKKLVQLASGLAKGPDRWEGPTMKKAHEGMRITDAEFDAVRIELRLALLHNRVAPEDVALILAAVDSTRPDIVSASGRPGLTLPPERTPWDRLGGEEGVKAKISDLIDRAVKDERVNFSRGGKYPMTEEKIKHLKQQFFDLALAALGKGQGAYKGKSMLEVHKRMGITDSEFDAFLDVLTKVLRENNVAPLDILLIQKALESKREDIVEKPHKASDRAREAPPKAEAPGQSRAPGGTSPAPAGNSRNLVDIVIDWFFPPAGTPPPRR